MKLYVFLALIAVVSATPLIRLRREAELEEPKAEERLASAYHHEVEHEHAKSHQSIKFHHFHPVPVYVKKEHLHLLKDPLEKGKSSHGVKQIHPKTEHHHGYGLVLESHGYDHGIHGRSEHEGFEHAPQIEHKESSEGESGWQGGEEQAPVYEHQELEHQQYLQYPGFSGYSGYSEHGQGEQGEGEESY